MSTECFPQMAALIGLLAMAYMIRAEVRYQRRETRRRAMLRHPTRNTCPVCNRPNPID